MPNRPRTRDFAKELLQLPSLAGSAEPGRHRWFSSAAPAAKNRKPALFRFSASAATATVKLPITTSRQNDSGPHPLQSCLPFRLARAPAGIPLPHAQTRKVSPQVWPAIRHLFPARSTETFARRMDVGACGKCRRSDDRLETHSRIEERRDPELPVVLSTTTSTGFALASKEQGERFETIYNPIDFFWTAQTCCSPDPAAAPYSRRSRSLAESHGRGESSRRHSWRLSMRASPADRSPATG